MRRSRRPKLGRFSTTVLALVLFAEPAIQLEEKLSHREISSYWTICAFAVVALFVLVRVVTTAIESQRLRNEIGAQNEQLLQVAALVASTDDSIVATTHDGTITSWNPASERLYGYTAEEMIGQRVHTIVEPERHHLVDATFAAIARGETIEPHEATGVRKDGVIFPVALTVSIVRDAQGVVIGTSTIARDISDRRAAEAERDALLAELGAQNERLRELDRMKDDFIASVSHELRTPLTSIRGYLELVREDGELGEEQERMLGIVDRNADRLLGLVTDLLFVAQVDAGKLTLEREVVHLASIAFEAVEAATPRADAVNVTLELDADDVIVEGDRTRLAQVLDNLISNAIKFTPGGGRVEVRIARERGAAVIEVSDTGIGIPEEERSQLFQRFFRTEAATRAAVPGTGLGLAIVGAIAESHGGSVAVAGREGGGTVFRVVLPCGTRELSPR